MDARQLYIGLGVFLKGRELFFLECLRPRVQTLALKKEEEEEGEKERGREKEKGQIKTCIAPLR